MKINQKTVPLKILDLDIENRPLSYWYDGNCTAEITAIAWSWVGSDDVYCFCLGEYGPEEIIGSFLSFYGEADIVTGHYIRRHDLPIINGACMELGLPPLAPKLAQDTKLDLVKTGGLSMSQEALSAMFELDNAKHHMTQSDWREANKLTPEGIRKTRKRVVDDVIQHKELRKVLLPYLKKPKEWKP